VNEVVNAINAVIPWPAWSIGLSVLGIIVQILAGPKPKWAWIVGMASQVPWWVYAVVSNQWGFFVSSTIYFVVYAVHHVRLRRTLGETTEKTSPMVITVEPEEVSA
jgi:hypothetical protein